MKGDANFWILCSLFLILTTPSDADDCSPTNVATKLLKCNMLAGVSSTTLVSTFKSILFSYCDSLECNIACRESIERPCLSQGVVYDDLDAKRVTHRYMCAIKDDYVKALSKCSSYNYWTCLRNFQTAVQDATSTLRLHPNNYKSYFSDYCAAVRNYRTCASATPWQPEYTCSDDLAGIMTNITDVSLSMKVCGIPQTNPLFNSRYSKPVDTSIVQTCGGMRLQTSFTLAFILLRELVVSLMS